MNEHPVVGRCRFRYPGKPWGPWFVFRQDGDEVFRNMQTVRLGAWRTDHRYRCMKCNRSFLGGPGSMSGHDGCPKCGHAYWNWETWNEVNGERSD